MAKTINFDAVVNGETKDWGITYRGEKPSIEVCKEWLEKHHGVVIEKLTVQAPMKRYHFWVQTETQVDDFSILSATPVSVWDATQMYEQDCKVKPHLVMLKKDSKLCKYCNSLNFSKDADVLCPDCRETFGHTFYSEL